MDPDSNRETKNLLFWEVLKIVDPTWDSSRLFVFKKKKTGVHIATSVYLYLRMFIINIGSLPIVSREWVEPHLGVRPS